MRHSKLLLSALLTTAVIVGGVVGRISANFDTFNSKGRIQSANIIFDSTDFQVVADAYSSGKAASEQAGKDAVINNPSLYGLYTENDLNTAITNAKEEVIADPGAYGISSNIICLGTSRSYDLTSYPGYENFTEDNFICTCEYGARPAYGGHEYSGQWWWTAVGSYTPPAKSYDSSTGILTITGASVGGGTGRNSTSTLSEWTSANLTVTTYLIP